LTAKSCTRTPTILLGVTRNFTARRCSVCARKTFGQLRHHGGISPAWPISYDELEPYYTEAEHLYQVHGTRGEDPASRGPGAPYKYPAVSHEQRIQHLHDDLERAGLKPFHVPLGIRIEEKQSAPESVHSLQHVRRPSMFDWRKG
jgi:choline dehydrogenase-like flavoprotein